MPLLKIVKRKDTINIPILPTELWLIIFNIVIEDGIIRLDHCDHTNFPYIQGILPERRYRYRFYESYLQLRLVCRRFNILLGGPYSVKTYNILLGGLHPYPIMVTDLFSMTTTTRAAYIRISTAYNTNWRGLSTKVKCLQLISLDLSCGFNRGGVRTNLVNFLRAGYKSQSFRNVQRLTIRDYGTSGWTQTKETAFWISLQNAFPMLVTLVVTLDHRSGISCEGITLERLEILYLSCEITGRGFCFSNLRRASITRCREPELQMLSRSPYLESLLIRSSPPASVVLDLRSFLHLKLLGVRESYLPKVVFPYAGHSLEHFWMISGDEDTNIIPYGSRKGDRRYGPFVQILEGLPGISRITVDLSEATEYFLWRRTKYYRKLLRTSAFSKLSMRPTGREDRYLVIDRRDATVKEGMFRKIWEKMRR